MSIPLGHSLGLVGWGVSIWCDDPLGYDQELVPRFTNSEAPAGSISFYLISSLKG